MIINCPNCNKRFKINTSLIPVEGRDLKCGSCDHVWFYKIEDTKLEPLPLKEDIIDNEEKLFENVMDFGQGVQLGMERQLKDYYYVELEKENKIAYVIVQVKKGAFVNGNKVILKNNEHRFSQLGFDSKEYHNDWNEFRNEFTPNEYKEWKKFTKSWREIIS